MTSLIWNRFVNVACYSVFGLGVTLIGLSYFFPLYKDSLVWNSDSRNMIALTAKFTGSLNGTGSIPQTRVYRPLWQNSTDLTDKEWTLSTLTATVSSTPGDCPMQKFLKELNSAEDLRKINDECGLLLYNRVPKCASSAVHSLLEKLSKDNNFHFDRAQGHFYSGPWEKQKRVALDILGLERPYVYVRHMYFIPFHSLTVTQPFMMNVVRHPVNRTISHFYYNNYDMGDTLKERLGKGKKPQGSVVSCALGSGGCNVFVSYFCGMDSVCASRDHTALQRAMRNVEEYGMIVGISEDLGSFFWVMETLLPRIFKGVGKKYEEYEKSLFDETSTQKAKDRFPLKQTDLDQLPAILATEIELYEFFKQRFYTFKKKLELIVKPGL